MSAHWDPLAQQESLRRPFLGSVVLHGCFCSLALLYSWIAASRQVRFGNPNATPGGTIPINIVKNIPLAPAQTLIENPVANASRSSIPTPPPEKVPAKKADAAEEGIPVPSRAARKTVERPAPERKFRPYIPDRDNQLYSPQGMGVNTPSYSGLQPDAVGVGVGIGAGGPLGARDGVYLEALQRRIGQQWQRELAQLDPRVREAPRAVVVFEILTDGSLRGIRLLHSSGNSSLDYSALRAVTNANPVPPLPAGLGKSSVTTEVWFQLKR